VVESGAGKVSAKGHRGRRFSGKRRQWGGEMRLGDIGKLRTRDPIKRYFS
jgi:hypothetical protein